MNQWNLLGLGLLALLGVMQFHMIYANSLESAESVKPSIESKKSPEDQRLALKVFKHIQETELTELKSSQAAFLKEWTNTEKKLRHEFFEEHTAGTERRAYIQSFIKRREDLLLKNKLEKEAKIQEQKRLLKEFLKKFEDDHKKN